MKKITYKKAGVNYDMLDPVKKLAQIEGLKTAVNIKGTFHNELSVSRGESVYIIEAPDCYYAIVEEGLGTKNLVADNVREITGKTYYREIAIDTVASIVNDIITTGARPLTVLAYWGVGDSAWFADKRRVEDLVSGWKKACDLSQATWGGGETPSDTDLINPKSIVLAGSSFGIIKPKKRIILGDRLSLGDNIILFESSGIHTNGISLTRKLAEKLPKRYATRLDNGKVFGEEILKPSIIYAPLINELLEDGIDIHYMVHITGHGWRKIMRAGKEFRYVLDDIPPIPELFKFIKIHSGLSLREMYGIFNMGAGFAVIVPSNDQEKTVKIAKKHQIKAWVGGKVEKGKASVEIRKHNIVFKKKELSIR